MKVILLQDVARVGKKFDVKDVPDGHALNFLIPRKMVLPATPENLKRVEERKGKQVLRSEDAAGAFGDLVSKLADVKVDMPVDANEQGHLFKGIKVEEIAAVVSKEVGMLDAEDIVLKTPIKSTGEHTIALKHDKQEGVLVLNVVAK